MPIANAPAAQSPYSTMRPLQKLVVRPTRPSPWPITAEEERRRRERAATAPAQSQRDHVARHAAHRLRCASAAASRRYRATRNSATSCRADERREHTRRRTRRATERRVGAVDSAHVAARARASQPDRRTAPRRGSARTTAPERRPSPTAAKHGPGPRDDHAGEGVRGEDRRRHHERLQVLDRLEGGRRRLRSTRRAPSATGRAT